MHYELRILNCYPCHPFIKPLNNLQMNSNEIMTTANPQHGIIARIKVINLIPKLLNFKYHSQIKMAVDPMIGDNMMP